MKCNETCIDDIYIDCYLAELPFMGDVKPISKNIVVANAVRIDIDCGNNIVTKAEYDKRNKS